MADPRNVVDFEGIDYGASTYTIDGTTIVFDGTKARGAAATMIDKAVTLSGNGVISLCADGDVVLGRLELVESDGKCTVQDDGATNLPAGNGATVTAGQPIVGALGAGAARGFIRNGVATDDPKAKHEILDASDTTRVKVRFD